ncbi:hypothetical protein PDESU_02048 [Pontiella desulfatans]|jgi:hypothetical protein|uniref:Uncharacterized protein n=1 Tax=Pontiella desulfatans TaxID=2750659 RepID=A0A6C2U1M5_PONDE|nr:hypothetical protein [Pontiella desulfatans]VGO13491.1 hypothetical protein PDESU_02048 [Pontiella desulfatans]
MKLNEKDKAFLERLQKLIDQDAVWIERTFDSPFYFVLRGNYGEHVERLFKLTRQGVRWRFWRLFNDIYVSAYETIIFIEKQLGTGFRQDALIIAHDRFIQRQRALTEPSFREVNPYAGKNKD